VQRFINTLLTGVTLGAVYAAFALAIVLIWRSTRVINIAQAPIAMITTYVAVTLIDARAPYYLAFVVALVVGFALGVVIERLLMRPVRSRPDINTLIMGLGIFVVLQSIASLVFGGSYKTLPAPFGAEGIKVGSATYALTGFGIFTLVAVAVVLIGLLLLFKRTNLGLTMRASAFGAETASLLGVHVERMLTLGWGLAALVGSLSGLLVAGGSLVSPEYMNPMIVYGFAAAALGGFDSPVGAVAGGLLVGILLSFVSGYVGSGLVAIAALILLVAVLLFRPQGVFSKLRLRAV